jgi:hypothetical protein
MAESRRYLKQEKNELSIILIIDTKPLLLTSDLLSLIPFRLLTSQTEPHAHRNQYGLSTDNLKFNLEKGVRG